jgi:hypothetical protein
MVNKGSVQGGGPTIDETSDGDCKELDPAESQDYVDIEGIIRLTIS